MRCQWGPCYRTATVEEDGYWWCSDDVQQHRDYVLAESAGPSRVIGKGRLLDLPEDEIREGFAAGMTNVELASRYGVSAKTINRRRQWLATGVHST